MKIVDSIKSSISKNRTFEVFEEDVNDFLTICDWLKVRPVCKGRKTSLEEGKRYFFHAKLNDKKYSKFEDKWRKRYINKTHWNIICDNC